MNKITSSWIYGIGKMCAVSLFIELSLAHLSCREVCIARLTAQHIEFKQLLSAPIETICHSNEITRFACVSPQRGRDRSWPANLFTYASSRLGCLFVFHCACSRIYRIKGRAAVRSARAVISWKMIDFFICTDAMMLLVFIEFSIYMTH